MTTKLHNNRNLRESQLRDFHVSVGCSYYGIICYRVLTVLINIAVHLLAFSYPTDFAGFDPLMITKLQWIVINLVLTLFTFIYINLHVRSLCLINLKQQRKDDEQQERKHEKLLYTSSIVLYNRVRFNETYLLNFI